jgi:hypothetical protein
MSSSRPPQWSSGQSSSLQIQRSEFNPRPYEIFWEVVGPELGGPLSLVSTIQELLERKRSCSCVEDRDYGGRGSAALTTRHPSIRKSALTSPTSGGRSQTQPTQSFYEQFSELSSSLHSRYHYGTGCILSGIKVKLVAKNRRFFHNRL